MRLGCPWEARSSEGRRDSYEIEVLGVNCGVLGTLSVRQNGASFCPAVVALCRSPGLVEIPTSLFPRSAPRRLRAATETGQIMCQETGQIMYSKHPPLRDWPLNPLR